MYRFLFYLSFLFVSFALFTNCSDKEPSKTFAKSNFFDLKDFFEKEKKEFSFSKIEKKVAIKEKEEVKTFSVANFDFDKEWKIFKDSDINKPSWRDAYKSDTVASGDTLNIVYTALKKDLNTQKMEILLDKTKQKILKVSINKVLNTPIYHSDQYLTYIPTQGYTIESSQQAIAQKKGNYRIEVRFLK